MSKAPGWLLIDGYDLLMRGVQAADGLPRTRSRKVREDLNSLLARYALMRDCRVTVVYEGRLDDEPEPARREIDRLVALVTPPGREAWKEIERLATAHVPPDDVVVVTSHRVAEELEEKIGVHRIEPFEFFAQLRALLGGEGAHSAGEPVQKYVGLDKDEVKMWRDLFLRRGRPARGHRNQGGRTRGSGDR